jgi:hypothetical protein
MRNGLSKKFTQEIRINNYLTEIEAISSRSSILKYFKCFKKMVLKPDDK